MPGTNAQTGKELTGLAHLRQSVRDILTTPIGTRVMRREYGSRLMELVDAPLTPATLTEIYAAAAEALARWEPRLRVDRIKASVAGEGNSVAGEENTPGSAGGSPLGRPARGQAAAAASPSSGHVLIDLEGVYLPGGEPVRLEGLEI